VRIPSLLPGLLSLASCVMPVGHARAVNTAPVLLDDTVLHYELLGGSFAGIVLPLPSPASIGMDHERHELDWFVARITTGQTVPSGVPCEAFQGEEDHWVLTCDLGADPPARLLVDLVIRERDTVERLESDDLLTLSISLGHRRPE